MFVPAKNERKKNEFVNLLNVSPRHEDMAEYRYIS
jgi:hypothetical protein